MAGSMFTRLWGLPLLSFAKLTTEPQEYFPHPFDVIARFIAFEKSNNFRKHVAYIAFPVTYLSLTFRWPPLLLHFCIGWLLLFLFLLRFFGSRGLRRGRV